MPALPPATGRRFDQNRFADAGLAAYGEGTTGLGGRVDGRGQDLDLVVTTNDLRRRPAQRRNHLPDFTPTGCRVAAGRAAAVAGG